MSAFDPRSEVALRGADEARRQAESRRAGEVARGAALARDLPALQGAPDAAATASIAQVLCDAEGLTVEGRIAFLAAASSGGATAAAPASDPGAPLRKQLEERFPAESEAREELGAAIARLRGEAASGDAAGAIAREMILRATSLGAVARVARPSSERVRDGMERSRPASLFEAAYGARAARAVVSSTQADAPTAPQPATVIPTAPSVAVPSAIARATAPPIEAASSAPSAVASLPSAPSLLAGLRAAFVSPADSLLVTSPKLQVVAGRFEAMRASLEKARLVLGDGAGENVRVRYGLRQAGAALTSAEGHVLAAESRLVREVVPGRSIKSLLGGLGEAQGELRAVGPWAEVAHGELADVVAMAQTTDVGAAIGTIDAVAWEALAAERELGVVEGQASVLADAASPAVAPEESASSSSDPSADSEAEPGIALTEDDLRLLGSGLDPSRPAPQILWTEESVNATCEQGRAQGGVTDAEGQAHLDLAQRLLAGATAPVELGAADVAAVLKEAGVALETVDPQQLESAARYVNTAQTTAEQADKLRKAIDSFQTLSRVGAPKLTRQEMVNELWAAAKVPGHALGKLSDSAVATALQQVRAALNGGPGEHQIKVGSYTLKLGVGANGALKATSCKKPGLFSKVGSFLKKAVPIALTVMSFIPATAVFARIAQGAISLVKSIQAKSVLGAVTSAASLVAGGAAAIAGKAVNVAGTAAHKVMSIANGVSRSLQGVSSLRQGSVLGGLAAIGSGVAGGIGSFAKGVGDGLSGMAKSLGDVSTRLAQAGQAVSTVEGYRAAGRAVEEARAALRQAEASGDAGAIAAAREGLARAESAKTGAVLGSVASAASLAADVRASYAKQPGQAVDTPPAKVTLDVALRAAWRGLNVARGIHERDWAAAGVSALGFAAVGRQAAGKEPADKIGFTDAANLADAALGAHQASRGEAAANTSVEDAERALRVARYTGDPAAIRQAEATLAQAKKAREGALMGTIAANESLLATAATIGEKLQASRTAATGSAEAAPKLDPEAQKEVDRAVAAWQEADAVQQEWAAQAVDEKATPEARAAARAGVEALEQAKAAYNRSLDAAKGDPALLRAATDTFAGLRRGISEAVAQAATAAPSEPSQPGFASMRVPRPFGQATVRPGATVWELSERTGVPVERILEFNAQMGNPLVPERLQVGQKILVPLGPDEVKSRPKSAEEVQALVDRAVLEKQLASITAPDYLSPEGPFLYDATRNPLDPAQKEQALGIVRNDRALIAEDEKASQFRFGSPSTWVDTKEDEARLQAREAFRRSVDRYEDLVRDPGASAELLRAAEQQKLLAMQAYNAARGVTEGQAASASYFTPLAELAAKGQDAVHDANRGLRTAVADTLTSVGVPSAIVGAVTLPSHVFDSVVDFDAGVAKGVVQLADGLAGMVAHPVQTVQGVASLVDRAAQATPQGRMLELAFETALGKQHTSAELLERLDPVDLAKAQVDLAVDVGKGMFAESIRLVREGKYSEALGTVIGQNVDLVFGAGMVGRSGKLRAAVEAAEATGTARRGVEVAGRAAAEVGDAARPVARAAVPETRAATEAATATAERTWAAKAVDTIPLERGETSYTRLGKSIHKQLADERRAAGHFDLVNEPISDARGKPIEVPRRVDLKTGAPVTEKGTQTTWPDGVIFGRDLILDDKPLTRLVSRDRQEIIRFVTAYEQRTGRMPRYIAITRYDHTGAPVRTDLYRPETFLPKSR